MILFGLWSRSRGRSRCCYRFGPSPGGSESFGFRADETKLSQALELCVRYPLLFGETLLFNLGSMEHMGPELIKVGRGRSRRSGREGNNTGLRRRLIEPKRPCLVLEMSRARGASRVAYVPVSILV